MANNVFDATDIPGDALPEAVTLTELQTILKNEKVHWSWKDKLSIGYDPFLVKITAIDAKNITYSFVNCADGKSVDASAFVVARDDLDVAHLDAPSTDRSKLDVAAGKAIVFLMLNPARLSPAAKQVAVNMSQPATLSGKWPGTALSELKLRDARRLIEALLGRLALGGISTNDLAKFRAEADSL